LVPLLLTGAVKDWEEFIADSFQHGMSLHLEESSIKQQVCHWLRSHAAVSQWPFTPCLLRHVCLSGPTSHPQQELQLHGRHMAVFTYCWNLSGCHWIHTGLSTAAASHQASWGSCCLACHLRWTIAHALLGLQDKAAAQDHQRTLMLRPPVTPVCCMLAAGAGVQAAAARGAQAGVPCPVQCSCTR
jgi:hypothetical protein